MEDYCSDDIARSEGSRKMLSREDNELMCRVGTGTAMGTALRRYWLPALQSSELPEPGGDPRRVELLGETFVAFRGSDGRVGILDEFCPHRAASLVLGRVEDCGLRCIYHGWKFDADGKVLEAPNVSDAKFTQRLKARAYPVQEAGGLIWTYLGVAAECPPFPAWPWLKVPARHRLTSLHRLNCNFVQILEGLVDSTHLNVLHADGLRSSAATELEWAQHARLLATDGAPKLEAARTPYGFRYAALREGGHTRITAFAAPCTVFNANGDIVTLVVPASDERSSFYHVFWDEARPIGEEPLRTEHLKFLGLDRDTLEKAGITPDLASTSRAPSYANRFHQDRALMHSGSSFSGLPGVIAEDVAVSVSAGPIRDRTREMLSAADAGVSMLHRVLLACANAALRGAEPIGVGTDIDTSVVEGKTIYLKGSQSWQ
jgi:phenylpropionate dioxygenase-like ring-hydroxylating dioxygenase large terminal subunit